MSILFFTYSLLFGLGCSCTFSSGLVVINQFFKRRRSLATGTLLAGVGGGILIMSPTLEALIRTTSWQTTYHIMAGVAFVLCLLAITFDPNVEKDDDNSNSKETAERVEGSGRENDEKIVTKIKNVLDFSVWKEPLVVTLILAAGIITFGHFVPQIHLVSAWSDSLSLGSSYISYKLDWSSFWTWCVQLHVMLTNSLSGQEQLTIYLFIYFYNIYTG